MQLCFVVNLFRIFSGCSKQKQSVDLRGLTSDPVAAAGMAAGRRFLIEVPITKVRLLNFWGGDPNNPWVLTLREYAAGRCSHFKGSPMDDFYQKWQPYTSGYVGDPMSPWKTFTRSNPRNSASGRLRRKEFRAIANELAVSADEVHGHIKGGPVTDAFGQITFLRLTGLYDSIQRSGFRPEASAARFPSATCFVRGHDDFRVSIGSGKHRVTVMLALGWQNIPVEFGPPKLPVITRREEVDTWPNVRAGYFTREEALLVFDEMFRLTHPSGWSPCEAS